MQKSLQAQEELVGHNERLNQVEDFKNRLEALASPGIVECFNEGNTEQACNFVRIFSSIQRLPQLYQYYKAVHKTNLQQKWKQSLDLQVSLELSSFYDILLEFCQNQQKWCLKVFEGNDDLHLPFVIIEELLPNLQPSRDAYLMGLLKTSNNRLELLQQYSQVLIILMAYLNILFKFVIAGKSQFCLTFECFYSWHTY